MVRVEDIQEVISSTINEYYGLDNKCSIIKSSPYYQQALEMSEKYGLKLKKCTRDQLRFEDTGHTNPLNENITSTEIRFDGMLGEGHIDFTNSGDDIENGVYTMDTVLGYYDSMPYNLKCGTGLITFTQEEASNHSVCYDPFLRKENVIHMTMDTYEGGRDEDFSMERIMAHEMGHCLEFGQLDSNDKNIIKKAMVDGMLTFEEQEYMMNVTIPKTHMYSGDGGVFKEAVLQEAGSYDEVGSVIQSAYATGYYLTTMDSNCELGEHFAETVSMVSFKDKGDKGNAKLNTSSVLGSMLGLKNIIDYDTFYDGSKQTDSINVVEGLLGLESTTF